MRILILYGTSEGQTRRIAGFVAERLVRHGHAVTSIDVLHLPPALSLDNFDAAIIAARVHAGLFQRRIAAFVTANREALRAMPNAFLSVSMSAANLRPGDLDRAKGYAEGFVRQTGWAPREIVHVAGARLYTHHNALGRWILGVVDRHRFDTTRDHVWTDWPALERFADAFGDGDMPTA